MSDNFIEDATLFLLGVYEGDWKPGDIPVGDVPVTRHFHDMVLAAFGARAIVFIVFGIQRRGKLQDISGYRTGY